MEVMTSVCVVCRADPRIQALDHVAMTIDGFADCSVLWTLPTAVKSRLEHLSQRVLRRIRDASELGDKDKRQQLEPATRYAAAMGNLPLMQQLHEIGFVPLDNRMAVAAALNGDLSLLKWIQASAPQLFNHVRSWAEQVAFDVAAERGCLETVQWLVETFPGAVWPLGPAALGGNLGMVKWLHEHANLEAAQMHFHFGILDKLTFVQCTQYVEECCSDEKEGVEAVGWRFHDQRTPRATDPMDWAALRGHLDVLQWLDVNRSEGCSAEAVNGAAEAGDWQILLWLNTHYSSQWTSEAFDCAARGGQLEIVKWMHENRSEGCSPAALDSAAGNGHLEVVKWLHDNRGEGCTAAAIDEAATNGHLDTVKWLHANRSEGCTTRAMDGASASGHHEVVKWLHENRSEGCTTNAVDYAAGYGHLE